MNPENIELRRRFEQLDPLELKQRVEAGVLTADAERVAVAVLEASGVSASKPTLAVDAQRSEADSAEDEKNARALWRGWRVQIVALMGAAIAWNLGRALWASVAGVRLGAVFVFVLLPLGYFLTRAILRRVVLNTEATQRDRQQFLIVALIVAFLMLGASGVWSESALRALTR